MIIRILKMRRVQMQDKIVINDYIRGNNNQNVIDVRKSLKQGKVVLYCD